MFGGEKGGGFLQGGRQRRKDTRGGFHERAFREGSGWQWILNTAE